MIIMFKRQFIIFYTFMKPKQILTKFKIIQICTGWLKRQNQPFIILFWMLSLTVFTAIEPMLFGPILSNLHFIRNSLLPQTITLLAICLYLALTQIPICPCAATSSYTNYGPLEYSCSPTSACAPQTGCYTNKNFVASTIGQIVQCKPCYCQTEWTPNYIATPLNGANVFYSCESSCKGASNCFRGPYRNFSLTSGVTKQIYRCYLCSIQYCVQCRTLTECVKCQDEYAVNDIKTCNHCPAMFGSGCKTCTLAGCITCNAGFCRDPTGTSKACHIPSDLNCTTCTNSYCSNCVTGRTLAANKTCQLCNTIPNCATCLTNKYGCATCNSPYIVKSIDSSHICIQCSDVALCNACSNGPVCTSCQTGYFPNPLTSFSTCASCSTISNCDMCSNTAAVCTSCQQNFFHDYSASVNYCVTCNINKCLICDHGPICLSCQTNFIPHPTTSKTCVSCPINQFSFNNLCYQCQSNITGCAQCFFNSSFVNCIACQIGWALNRLTYQCIDCSSIPLCLQCSDNQTCTKCKNPYKLGLLGLCDQCKDGFQYLHGTCNMRGCLTALFDYSKCLVCRVTNNFVYDASKNICACKLGYKFVKVEEATICESVCGNGITSLPDEECDDGNLLNGDGCDQNCKVEDDFICTPIKPSKCVFNLKINHLKYNYASIIQGKSRGKLSFSLYPLHEVYRFVDWSKYLILNISSDFIKTDTIIHYFETETKEICMQFDYKKSIENLVVNATFSFSQTSVQSSFQSVNASIIQTHPEISADPSELSVSIQLKGVNSALTFVEESIFRAYEASSIGFMVITIVVLLVFVIGSYSHKMIGLQTIQILQYFYFLTMIVDDNKKSSLQSLNIFKYTSFGGYSNNNAFYGEIQRQIESLTYQTVERNFIFVGLKKYFVINVNFSLIIPVLALVVYTFYLIRKFINRSKYLKTGQKHYKDFYITLKRSSQWIYDHCLFPLVNLFSMIAFFCTILELDILDVSDEIIKKNQQIINKIQQTNFMVNLMFVFLIFFMFSFEVFVSYDLYKYESMSKQQKARVPSSTIQKLEHDGNNSDKENYKPGYILVYLMFYFMTQIILMMNILVEEISTYGLEIMLGLQLIYLAIVCFWQPYIQAVNFHNRGLKLNHSAALLFTLICALINRVKIPQQFEIFLIFLSLVMLIVVFFGSVIRIYLELQFRKKFQKNPNGFECKEQSNKMKTNPLLNLSKKQHLLLNNKYIYDFRLQNVQKKTQKLTDEIYSKGKFKPEQMETYLPGKNMERRGKQQFYSDMVDFIHKNDDDHKFHANKLINSIDLKKRTNYRGKSKIKEGQIMI